MELLRRCRFFDAKARLSQALLSSIGFESPEYRSRSMLSTSWAALSSAVAGAGASLSARSLVILSSSSVENFRFSLLIAPIFDATVKI